MNTGKQTSELLNHQTTCLYIPMQKLVWMCDDFSCRMGCRCFWDSDTDSYAQDIFMNVSVAMS